ncbi:hypothetical protein H4R19_000800 [Coemansia spiralis]|nr:hypothetical protein H4R19_000800 [Coemansia spiralis]
MSASEDHEASRHRFGLKLQITKMFAGGMIVTVKNPSQACIAEAYGARALIAIEQSGDAGGGGGMGMMGMGMGGGGGGGSGTTSDLQVIKNVMDRVMVPVIVRVRMGHELEAQVMEEAHVDMIDECELLMDTGMGQINKRPFQIPFMGEAATLQEALKRIKGGCSIIRTRYSGSEDNADIKTTVDMVRAFMAEIQKLRVKNEIQKINYARTEDVSIDLVNMVARSGALPVPFYAAGGIFMPIDVALLMRLGCNGVVVSSRIFTIMSPESRLQAIADAIANHKTPAKLTGLIEWTGGQGT